MPKLTKMQTMHKINDTCWIEQKLIRKHVRHWYFQLCSNWFNYASKSTGNEINWNFFLMQFFYQHPKYNKFITNIAILHGLKLKLKTVSNT